MSPLVGLHAALKYTKEKRKFLHCMHCMPCHPPRGVNRKSEGAKCWGRVSNENRRPAPNKPAAIQTQKIATARASAPQSPCVGALLFAEPPVNTRRATLAGHAAAKKILISPLPPNRTLTGKKPRPVCCTCRNRAIPFLS